MPLFISYSFKDDEMHLKLRAALEAIDFSCWNTKQMRLGASLAEQLRKAINSCDLCIFIATESSVKSPWCAAETGAFWGAGKKVLILQGDPMLSKDKLPPQFRQDLLATDIAEIIKEILSMGIASPEKDPALLFFFSSVGYTTADKDKIDFIRKVIFKENKIYQAYPHIPFQQFGVKEDAGIDRLDTAILEKYKGIFMALPYGEKLSESLVNRLVKWVHAGGNLVLTCFELGERHHNTNINRLAYHFGIKFNSDVIVPSDISDNEYNKGYNRQVFYNQFNNSMSETLFNEVETIGMRNACTLSLEPGSTSLVLVQPNKIKELVHGDYSPDFTLAIGEQRFKPGFINQERAVIAIAPEGLTVKGKVLAIGTWDFFCDEKKCNNEKFLLNLAAWMAG